MININRLGLGCMSMNRRNAEKSIRTIHYALDKGITLFNTGEFYQAGESEIVVGEALKGVPRDKYFISVKYGVLPKLEAGRYSLYGLDVNPFNVKAHVTYSLTRLGIDYIDLYEPARMDLAIPVEDIIGELSNLVREGYIRHIGLTQIDEKTLKRANKVHQIHTVELLYSLADRAYEKGMFQTAHELGIKVLAFGALSHGLLNDSILTNSSKSSIPIGIFAPENLSDNLKLVRDLKAIADKHNTNIATLALAWTFSKYPYISTLVGTTSPEHLQDSIDALSIELNKEDIEEIENAFPAEKVKGTGMGDFICRNGKLVNFD